VSRPVAEIKAYLRSLSSGSTAVFRTKLLVVGIGGVGKTSLIRCLTRGKDAFEPQSASTDGIDIGAWTVPAGDSAGNTIELAVYDFAGQGTYMATHTFWISSRSVMLAVWNARLGFEHSGLLHWLSSLRAHAPKSKVIVVATHCDMVQMPELPTRALRDKFPGIVGFFATSAATGMGTDALREAVIAAARTEPYMGEMIPTRWLALGHAVREVARSGKSGGILTYDEYSTRIAAPLQVAGDELARATHFLDSLGTLSHHDVAGLRHLVICDPQWLVDVMACIVSAQRRSLCLDFGPLLFLWVFWGGFGLGFFFFLTRALS
jgi:GTPase SAR1 family protein